MQRIGNFRGAITLDLKIAKVEIALGSKMSELNYWCLQGRKAIKYNHAPLCFGWFYAVTSVQLFLLCKCCSWHFTNRKQSRLIIEKYKHAIQVLIWILSWVLSLSPSSFASSLPLKQEPCFGHSSLENVKLFLYLLRARAANLLSLNRFWGKCLLFSFMEGTEWYANVHK